MFEKILHVGLHHLVRESPVASVGAIVGLVVAGTAGAPVVVAALAGAAVGKGIEVVAKAASGK